MFIDCHSILQCTVTFYNQLYCVQVHFAINCTVYRYILQSTLQCTGTLTFNCTVYRYINIQLYSVQVYLQSTVQCTGTIYNQMYSVVTFTLNCTVVHVRFAINCTVYRFIFQSTVQCSGTLLINRTVYRYILQSTV